MKTFKDILTPVSIVILCGVVLFDHMVPHKVTAPVPAHVPAPAVDGLAVGRAYAPVLLATYADAWSAAAKSLEEGGSVAGAQKTFQDTWKDARVKAFTDHVAASFALVLPEGAEPSTPEKRAQVVALWREFASGLKGAR
jgi:hypothetical protein